MKRLNKIIVCLGGVLVFSMGLNFSVQTIYAQENVAIVDEGQNGDIEEYKNVYVWKYKVVNGNLYKRKYNIVTGKWVGKVLFTKVSCIHTQYAKTYSYR